MPDTKAQKALAGAELGRLEKGQKTKTGMTKTQLEEMLQAPTKPAKKKSASGRRDAKSVS
jgi:hypothetical protein